MLKTGTTAIVASSRCVQSRNPRAARIWGPEITTASSPSRSLLSHAPNAAPGAVRSYAASPTAAPCTLPWHLRPRDAAVPWQASWRGPLRKQPARGWSLCQPARRSAGADLCVRGEWTCLCKIQSPAAHCARASGPTVDDALLTAPEFTRRRDSSRPSAPSRRSSPQSGAHARGTGRTPRRAPRAWSGPRRACALRRCAARAR